MSTRPPTLPGNPPQGKTSRRGGCIGLLLLLAGLLFVSVFVSSQRRGGVPTRPIAPTATATETATSTPIATSTPTEARPAIVLPTKTPTLAPAANNELVQYASELMGPAGDLQGGLHELGVLLMNPRLGSSDWMWQVATQMAIIRVSHDALTEITPPAAAATFHRHLIASTSLCSEATRKAAAGMDALDSDLLTEAAALMRACAAGLQSATVELEALAK